MKNAKLRPRWKCENEKSKGMVTYLCLSTMKRKLCLVRVFNDEKVRSSNGFCEKADAPGVIVADSGTALWKNTCPWLNQIVRDVLKWLWSALVHWYQTANDDRKLTGKTESSSKKKCATKAQPKPASSTPRRENVPCVLWALLVIYQNSSANIVCSKIPFWVSHSLFRMGQWVFRTTTGHCSLARRSYSGKRKCCLQNDQRPIVWHTCKKKTYCVKRTSWRPLYLRVVERVFWSGKARF